MAKGGGLAVYVTEGGRVAVRRVQRAGYSQRAFTNVVGSPAGSCVKAAGDLHGKSRSAIRKIVGDCGKNQAGKGKVKAEVARLRAEAR